MSDDLERLRRCHLAFDLGTARTRIYLKGSGVIVDEPSAVALCTRTGRLIAAGSAAQALEGRAPGHIVILRPVYADTVTDIGMAQRMLRMFLRGRVGGWRSRWLLRRVAVCLPYAPGQVALDACAAVFQGLGARRVVPVDRVFATAVGCGLDTGRAVGAMIVHCGTGSTQIALLSLGSVVTAQTVPVGENTFLQVLDQHIRDIYHLVLPLSGLQDVCRLLAAVPPSGEVELCGRDPATGAWRTVTAGAAGLHRTVGIPMGAVVRAVGQVLRDSPPDLVADLVDTGLTMTGSSITRLGLHQMISTATGITARTPARPELSAIRGLGDLLEGTTHPGHPDTVTGTHPHRPSPARPSHQTPAPRPTAPHRGDVGVQCAPEAVRKGAAPAGTQPRDGPRTRAPGPAAGKVRRPCRRTRLKYPTARDARSGQRQLRGKNGTRNADVFRRPTRYLK
ncbi:rod shape-determining protein [Streptomyces olivoreticuli]|uniref:rod shape-determining protein n=1 Tax=Streptomyces olivoreticuli TaxID=68246 RepID=UPI00265A09C3|nr:rod shape-determining protein [Streptomyces olivoreticuli]WKK27288.1 rod shape-determining protein [Streptomyces olivoreticuli]